MFNNAQIVLKSMSAEQLEQLRQRQKVKLDIPLVINFIIPNEFNDMMRKKNSFVLVLPKVIEELVQVSGLKVLVLKTLEDSSLNKITKIPLICRNCRNYRFSPQYKIDHNY